MKLPIYQVDAFAEKPFQGNPAAIVPLDNWLPDSVMQAIAEENNLAETAFFIPCGEHFHIRWFTPKTEVELCGHATLASAFVLFECLGFSSDSVSFESLSGVLSVSKQGKLLTMDFPSQPPEACDTPSQLVEGLGRCPAECYGGADYLAVFEKEEHIYPLEPNHEALKQLDRRGVIATAPSSEYDFVVRFFAPNVGIPEDPVTGSAYTQAMPYWSAKLNKQSLVAKQLSTRGGVVHCESAGDRTLISGSAVKYLEGTIEIDF